LNSVSSTPRFGIDWILGTLLASTATYLWISKGEEACKAEEKPKKAYDEEEFEKELLEIEARLESLMKMNLGVTSFPDVASQLWQMITQRGGAELPGVFQLNNPLTSALSRLTSMLESGYNRKRLCKPLAVAYILRGQYEQAMPFLIEANWENPLDPDLYLHQGHIYMNESNYSEAYENFEKALLLNPSLTIAIGPRNEMAKKLNLNQSSVLYWHVQGVIHYDLGMYQESYDCYKKALAINPKYEDSWYNSVVVKHILDQQARCDAQKIDMIPGKLLPIVTTYEYATMAEAAYATSAKAFPPHDWQLWTTSGDFLDQNGSLSRDGFFGAVYVNHQKEQIVLALQGSKATQDIISCIHLVFNNIDRQWVCAKVFGEKVHQKIASDPVLSKYRISLTGHSLGAAQAEFLSFIHDEPAVTFESPGISNLLASIGGHNVPLDDPNNFKITAYMPRPNIINTAKQHVGKVLRIYPPLPPKRIRAENVDVLRGTLDAMKRITDIVSVPGLDKLVTSPFGAELIKVLSETELMVLETAHWHSMARICQVLRHEYETGVPIKQREVIRWPRTENFYLFWRVARDSLGEPDESTLSDLNHQSLAFAHYEVKDRHMNQVPLSDFTRSEQRFLREFRRNPGAFAPYCSEIDLRVLGKYDIQYSHVDINVGMSPEHFRDFIQHKASQVAQQTETSALSFSSLF
jgi:tetratricopeptide (TPR) repeat protein